jgi:hypothetical protein
MSFIASAEALPPPSADELEALPAEELRAVVRALREEHAAQLDAEARARNEVEDMCLRIEKHFKAEKASHCLAIIPLACLGRRCTRRCCFCPLSTLW